MEILDDAEGHAAKKKKMDAAAAAAPGAPPRAPREKKESWKVKDSRGGAKQKQALTDASGEPIATTTTKKDKEKVIPYERLRPPPYRPSDFNAIPRLPTLLHSPAPIFNPDCPLYILGDKPINRRGYRYGTAAATPSMPAIMYRSIELPPYAARIDLQDIDARMAVNRACDMCATDKGFRMARANVWVREGHWYCEFRIIHGGDEESTSHVRIGFARRESPLDTPVGFDAYSYGIRDVHGDTVHVSRPKAFMNESLKEGDVVGFHIYLPPMSHPSAHDCPIRERVPIRYKGQLYFESYEYAPIKEMEDLVHPPTSTITAASNGKPVPKAAYTPPTLDGSFIKVYRNGKLAGTAFTDLYDFADSKLAIVNRMSDDGTLGYYPAISSFRGGQVQLNCGPDFEYPPPNDGDETPRPISDRFEEQIAEDIVWDIIDEVNYSDGAVPTTTAAELVATIEPSCLISKHPPTVHAPATPILPIATPDEDIAQRE